MAAVTGAASLKATYERDGFAFPFRVMAKREALDLSALAQRYAEDEAASRYLRTDAHLVFRFVDQLVRKDTVLDPVAAVLGPNVLLLRAAFFIKPPHSAGHIGWHQDLTYWGLDRDEEVTAWIAFTAASMESGCMRFLPGSHRHGIVEHVDTDDDSNLLSRSQAIKVAVDESKTVAAPLAAGEMSLHHGQIYHASSPNRTDGWRIGLAARFITPRMKQVVGSRDHAALVRGVDPYGNFTAPPRPSRDLDPAGIAFYDEISESKKEFLFQGIR